MTSRPELRPELVVLSHLDWDWVWQRPQQLVSRLASSYDVWFVEEPGCRTDIDRPQLRVDRGDDGINRLRMIVPATADRLGFDDPAAADYPSLVANFLGAAPAAGRIAWAYTPLAFPI